jgi:hypothetical protein
MPGIDDPYDQAKKQYEETSDANLKLILKLVGKFEPITGVISILQEHFSKDAFKAKINTLLELLDGDLRSLRKRVDKYDEKFDAISRKIESPEFAETLLVAINETVRTTNQNKVKRFALILGYTLTSDEESNSWDDAAAFIRAIAQLGDEDIRALKILHSEQSYLFPIDDDGYPDPNSFTEGINEVLLAVDESGMSRDEFYSRCSRLNGFGLAIEVQRNDGRMALGDYCFRITGLGMRLIEMIKADTDIS